MNTDLLRHTQISAEEIFCSPAPLFLKQVCKKSRRTQTYQPYSNFEINELSSEAIFPYRSFKVYLRGRHLNLTS